MSSNETRCNREEISMKISVLKALLMVLVGTLLTAGPQSVAMAQDWTAQPDVAKAKEQAAQGIITYGLPDDWANYGESLKQFCAHYQFSSCNHTDTDMSSNEEITRF